ncbi:MAG: cell wall hydrolase [Gemmobacter sp.]
MAGRIADYLLRGGARTLTHGATHFHAGAVKPGWSRVLARTTRIGSHHFYRL